LKPKSTRLIHYFAKNLSAILGIVLIWRGVWYLLDLLDEWLFGGGHWLAALGSVVAGVLILYLPDRDLSEIERP
jgi:hypothetical protein